MVLCFDTYAKVLRFKEAEDARWLTKDSLDSVAWLPVDITLIGRIREQMNV